MGARGTEDVLPETGLTLYSGDMVYTTGIWGEIPDAVENV
jgi:hypothetical protein